MVRLEEHKHSTEDKPIEILAAPAKVYIHLAQHIGKPCAPLVKVGEEVLLGQGIGSVEAHVWAPVHSSVSGKVSAIIDWPHPVSGRGKVVVIENNGLDKLFPQLATRNPQPENLSADQIREIVRDAGIVGMGGASFPTHVKLKPSKPVDTLIINGAECEPYLTGDYRLMIEKTDEILKGIGLVERALGVKKVYIAIEDNKPAAIKIFQDRVQVLKSQYPQGGEKQLIKNVLKKEVPSGKLPFDIGVVVQNVGTVFAIYEAVYLGKPLYERIVTVTGSCLANPKNLLVRIGTPIKELINYCAPLKEEPAKIIIGGPMMGIAQYTDEVPVIKSTTAVLLMSAQEAKAREEIFCIRCGECVRHCPSGLMPCMINLASEKELWPQAKQYGALDCIECGCCSYVCPANRRLVQSIRRAKIECI